MQIPNVDSTSEAMSYGRYNARFRCVKHRPVYAPGSISNECLPRKPTVRRDLVLIEWPATRGQLRSPVGRIPRRHGVGYRMSLTWPSVVMVNAVCVSVAALLSTFGCSSAYPVSELRCDG